MTGEEVLKLLSAGFTADEIRGMMQPAQPAPAQDPEPEDAPAAEPEPASEPEPEPQPEEQTRPLTADDVKKMVAAQIKAAQQAANARSASRPEESQQLTPEEVIKALVKKCF